MKETIKSLLKKTPPARLYLDARRKPVMSLADFLGEQQALDQLLEQWETLKHRTLVRGGDLCIIDNVYGRVCRIDEWRTGRDSGVARETGTWNRGRAMVYALTRALGWHPILPANKPDFRIRGVGLSDSETYARVLPLYCCYQNTYYHREPFLDICGDTSRYGDLDFIIASDVFEHVTPPVERAFANASRMLKKGGALILSVPYKTVGATEEHYPSLHQWRLERRFDWKRLVTWRIRNRTASGAEEFFEPLVFHGGPGTTVELRVFARDDLVRMADEAGFDLEVLEEELPLIGIWNHGRDYSLPMILRKR